MKKNQSKLSIKNNININNSINLKDTLIAIRVRPLNSKDKEESLYKTIKIVSNNQLKVSIPTEYSFEEKEKSTEIKVTKEKQTSFEFDQIFDENSSQSQVYEKVSYNLIDQIKEGYNATILTYGASGTGKSYTIYGSGDEFGIIFRIIKDLFNNINNKFIIKISYIEIYNEIIKDLLNINNNNNSIKIVLKEKVLDKNEAFS